MANKVVTLDDLAVRLTAERARGARVVLCHGCFDPLHIGHIRHFQEARRAGEFLVVTVTPDRFVDKGSGRPLQGQAVRAEAVAAIEAVDLVAVNAWPTAVETLRLLRPAVYAKGAEFRDDASDPTGRIALERHEAERLGIRMVFTDTMVEHSTSLVHRMKAAGIRLG